MSLLNNLLEIEIDPIDICNRSCSFCPRSFPSFSNTKAKLDLEMCSLINKRLKEINYSNTIGFAGFGEPLLHKELEQCISTIVEGLTLKEVHVVTNADYLTSDRLNKLYVAGVTKIRVSMYDKDISAILDKITHPSLEMEYRHYYNTTPTLVNRNEMWDNPKQLNIPRSCYIPFTSLLMDYHGYYYLCANDWRKQVSTGKVATTSIEEAWLGDTINTFRKMLIKEDRTARPCSTCDVNGCLVGSEQFTNFKEQLC